MQTFNFVSMRITQYGQPSKDRRYSEDFKPIQGFIKKELHQEFRSKLVEKDISISDALQLAIEIWLAYYKVGVGRDKNA